MCPKCQGFSQREKILQPHDLYSLVSQIETVVREGTLALVAGNCKLSDIRRGIPFPADRIEQTFACVSCAQKFKLDVDTYHGSGGDWACA